MSSNTRFRKGQFFSYDAIMGAVIFIFAIGLLLLYWYGARASISPEHEDLQREAIRISDVLLSTGSPGWETYVANPVQWGQITQLGLVNTSLPNSNKLDQYKLQAMMAFTGTSAGYNASKEKLQTPYDYNVTLEYDGAVIQCGVPASSPCAFGTVVPDSAPGGNSVEVTRLVVISSSPGKIATMKIRIWS